MTKAIKPFADDKYFDKNYETNDLPKSSEIDFGTPNAISMEQSLLIAIGGATKDEEYEDV